MLKIENDYFGALSEEWLGDKEASILESLSKLEKHFVAVAQGTMVTSAKEILTYQMARQQIAIDLLNETTSSSSK